jgi:hypothetical protein
MTRLMSTVNVGKRRREVPHELDERRRAARRERVVLDVQVRLARVIEVLAGLVEPDIPGHRALRVLVVEGPRVVADHVLLVPLEERGAVHAGFAGRAGGCTAAAVARGRDAEAERGYRNSDGRDRA